MLRRGATAGLLASIFVLGALPGSASAYLLGSPFTGTPDIVLDSCPPPGDTCTHGNSYRDLRFHSQRHLGGTITSWRVWWSGPGMARLRVMDFRSGETGKAAFVRSGPIVATQAGLNVFPISLPIGDGQTIAVDDLGDGNPLGTLESVLPAEDVFFEPVPVDGTNAEWDGFDTGIEPTLSADVELASNQLTIDVVKRQRRRGSISFNVTTDHHGTLQVSGGPLKTSTYAISEGGTHEIKVDPGHRAKKRLRRKGKASGEVTFVFTTTVDPFGAPPVTKKLPVTVIRKEKKRGK